MTPFGAIKLAEKPKLRVRIVAAEDGPQPVAATPDGPLEFAIHPGQTITLTVKVERPAATRDWSPSARKTPAATCRSASSWTTSA